MQEPTRPQTNGFHILAKPIGPICNLDYPKHRFIGTPDGESGLNYLCAGYKRFFKHIDPYMKFMAAELNAERPPANVMTWVKHRDMPNAERKRVGRNEPCPCGSGRKYKKCCGQEK